MHMHKARLTKHAVEDCGFMVTGRSLSGFRMRVYDIRHIVIGGRR